ncbi:hypothetical protein [Rhizobium rhizogenes]|uniref:Uncharacterized protein n=1 Tax=Rhizobium rhizogenes NBRC 13257 TaxID=1220581 RepID=A0AA87U3K1_RHIRH|nr:hypothetical protein [Rhizobium rhizogenes]GAJ91915.1 hypothetical protein RRH01S_02_05840 [Rhizobium rhizogenes NBRC 13257]
MYNLLMSGNVDEWNVAIGSVNETTFPLARYLEYTEEIIEQRLKPITSETVAFLSQLSTLFMSELQTEANGRQFLRIRVGKVPTISDYEAGLRRVPGEAVAAMEARFNEDERGKLAGMEPL